MYLLIKTFTSSRYVVCIQFLYTYSVHKRTQVHANDHACIGTAKTLYGK